MINLDPCPFCNGEAIMRDRLVDGRRQAGPRQYWAQCANGLTSKCKLRILGKPRPTPEDAAADWNDRAFKTQIEKAIWFIHTDQANGGDYDKGMIILCDLIGRKHNWPTDLKTSTIQEIARRPNSKPLTGIPASLDQIYRQTIFSPDRVYRYTLWRDWPRTLDQAAATKIRYAMFIGLNPSTADETKDDPTVRKCVKFAKAWGFDGLVMTNIFAYRATDPRKMKGFSKPIGPENDRWLVACAREASIIIAAWGLHGVFMGRDAEVLKILDGLECLGTNNDGTPKHPLYLLDTSQPQPFQLKESS